MQEICPTDLILLVLTGLSVLVGLSRGFCSELLRLLVYVFSGVAGYALIPVFRPVFTFVPYEPMQKMAAVALGTLIAWVVLKVLTASFVEMVKRSGLNKLDRSLGGVFGALRAGAVIVLVCFVFNICAPQQIQSSRILTLSSGMLRFLPYSETQEKQTENAEPLEWKKRLLYYLENKTVHTKDGEKNWMALLSSTAAKEFSNVLIERGALPEEENDNVSPAQKEEMVAEMFKNQLTAWLNGETVGKEEIGEDIQNKMIDLMKETGSFNEDFSD